MPLPLLPLAMSLAQYAPKLVGWLAGDKAEDTAEKVVDIAKSLTGKQDPAQAVEAIQQNPELQLKFQEQANQFELGLEREYTERIAIVNQTMQAEAKSEHTLQWIWRPLWGVISAVAFLIVCIFVCILGYRAISGKDPQAIGMIPLLIGAFTTLFGIPGAILGISAWGRNKLKEKTAQKLQSPTISDTIL